VVVVPGDPHIISSADLARYLRERISSGAWEPGDLLPSERDLIQRFDIGREVVRRAVRMLRGEGLIELLRGEGWAVRYPERREMLRVQRGSRISARMPSPDERDEQGIPEGVPVVVITYAERTTIYRADRWDFTTA